MKRKERHCPNIPQELEFSAANLYNKEETKKGWES